MQLQKVHQKQTHHFPHFDKFEENIFHISGVTIIVLGSQKRNFNNILKQTAVTQFLILSHLDLLKDTLETQTDSVEEEVLVYIVK